MTLRLIKSSVASASVGCCGVAPADAAVPEDAVVDPQMFSLQKSKNGGPKYGRLPVLAQAGSAGSGPQVVNPRNTLAKRSMGNLLASSTSGRRRPCPNLVLDAGSAIRFLKARGKNLRSRRGESSPRRGGASNRRPSSMRVKSSRRRVKWRREHLPTDRACVLCVASCLFSRPGIQS